MRYMMKALLALGLLAPVPASAVIIGGVDFPAGAVSFADSVVSYTPGSPAPTAPYQGVSNALGAPDYAGANTCAAQATCSFLTLGKGGSVVVRFVDNLLTGSGTAAADLWIFEIGPDVEDTFVDISVDGFTWLSVGAVGGSTAGVDIDAFGYGVGSAFTFVRLTDDPELDGQSGDTVGADIDAVGAISTLTVPEPTTWAMMIAGFGLVAGALRRSRTRAVRSFA